MPKTVSIGPKIWQTNEASFRTVLVSFMLLSGFLNVLIIQKMANLGFRMDCHTFQTVSALSLKLQTIDQTSIKFQHVHVFLYVEIF